MNLQIFKNIIGICADLKFENVNYSLEINHADADLKHLNQALVLLHYCKNSPLVLKSWIRAWDLWRKTIDEM